MIKNKESERQEIALVNRKEFDFLSWLALMKEASGENWTLAPTHILILTLSVLS